MLDAMNKTALRYITICILLGLSSFFLYRPLVSANTSYLYHEDDAHHFNRTIEMAQRRDLNPHYFNKPALHFYLRIPVVYAVTTYEYIRGRMNSIKEIRTRDPYGLAGYSYTPSHPRVLSATRLVSVVWSCLLPILTFLILRQLSAPQLIAAMAALLTTFSPEVTRNSYVVGVDTLMALLCLSTTTYALRALHVFSERRLVACALLAGLACAAKYNAAPICIVPVSLWWLCDRSKRGALIAAFVPVLGFLLGAPFSILSFQEFVHGVSYEAWHYAVAGHEGNSAERGLPQALFYLRWLISDGIGLCGALLIPIGTLSLFKINRRALLLIASFPLSYLCLMLLQKTHFTRNMLVVVPYAAIAVGVAVQAIGSWFRRPRYAVVAMILVFAFCLEPISSSSFAILAKARNTHESRNQVVQWVSQNRSAQDDVAIAGPLQLPIQTFAVSGVDAFDPAKSPLAKLIQSGYTYIVVPTDLQTLDAELAELVQSIPGNPSPQRVPANPAISILRVKERNVAVAASRAPFTIQLLSQGERLIPQCASYAKESHCWITARVTQVAIPQLTATHSFEIMSPWPDQLVTLVDSKGALLASVKLKVPGTWESIPISAREGQASTALTLSISQVHSPESMGLSSDTRRLGIAVR